jgi:site-specific DNA-cytosine methylase
MQINVLVACEFSATVRDAFIARGFNAWSCDLLPTEGRAANHLQGDVRHAIAGDLHRFPDAISVHGRQPLRVKWDLMIAHPPCTHLAASGARWWADKQTEQAEALDFVRLILGADIPHIAMENPVGIISTAIRQPDQYVHPWQFGHGETKKTGLWLKGLPPLQPTNIVAGRAPVCHYMPPSADRWAKRSRTYPGIAGAMADQWGRFVSTGVV